MSAAFGGSKTRLQKGLMHDSLMAPALLGIANHLPRPTRRRHVRTNTLGRAARLDALGDIGLCRVLNLSDGGMMIETPIALSCCSPVRISFDSTNVVQGRVVWRLGNCAGIRFLVPIQSVAWIRGIANDCWNRAARPPRLPVHTAARMTSGSTFFHGVIENISQDGMRIQHPRTIVTGATVEVELPGGMWVRGVARWSDETVAGISLLGRLTAEQLASVRRFQGNQRSNADVHESGTP